MSVTHAISCWFVQKYRLIPESASEGMDISLGLFKFSESLGCSGYAGMQFFESITLSCHTIITWCISVEKEEGLEP
jgi:hypothetical protein